MQIQQHHTDIGLALTAISFGTGKLIEDLHNLASTVNDLLPYLAAGSYVIGIVAGVLTIYFKIKNKQ